MQYLDPHRLAPHIILLYLLLAHTLCAQEQRLVILHTNDIHASYLPHVAPWTTGTPKAIIGGMVRLQEVVDSIRSCGYPTLLLDAGDVMTGTPISERSFHGALGGALFAMMDSLRYDAWCPGNHDLDISQANLIKLTHLAAFPTLSCNLTDQQGGYPLNNAPYVVLEKGGLKIGIVGVMSQELPDLVLQTNLQNLLVLSPAETAQRFIDTLRDKVDLVVLLTHEGADKDAILARATHGADVIVGGHSHTRLNSPRIVNGVQIVQAGSNCEDLGVLEVTFRSKKAAEYRGRLIPLWGHEGFRKGSVVKLVDSMEASLKSEYSEVLGITPEDWSQKERGAPLAVFVAEAQRTEARADVAFMNVHGIRNDLLAGPITKGDLFSILPFRNVLVTFQLTGAELMEVMCHVIENRKLIVAAGCTAEWRKGKGKKISLLDLRVDGNVVDRERLYTCVCSDYILGESVRYLGRSIQNPIYSSVTVYDVIERAIRREGTIRKPK